MTAEVLVTGVGLLTPAGIGVAESWERVLSGAPAARTDPELGGAISARVPGFDPVAALGARHAWRLDRFTQLALCAVREAVADAGLNPSTWDGARVAVVLGNSLGGTATFESQYRVFHDGHADEVSPLMVPMAMVNMVAGYVAIDIRATGPSLVTATACASGGTAVGIATALLRSGACDVAIAGGTEAAITPVTITGLRRMGALSGRDHDPATASRPFDLDRDGFVPGEGAGALVLERAADARARRVAGYARIAGYGASSDAHHATAPAPDGSGIRRALEAALTEAGVDPRAVDHVNAHGTSTPLNDVTEAKALRAVLGESIAVTSVKGVTGHTLAAAGAIEAVCAALTIRDGVIPPTAGTKQVDPRVEVDVVVGAARRARVDVAVSTSLGFGGHNAALVLTAP
ncbi:beta-ketoacyl-[acyl-carrier-protein] synthase family protein [Actinokineospora diospyrosa]|uniref:3-oxoacyl-[acyl-carrier-protein] synthase II n=1 Tax=Actinokineospora diospyrosa TaxID=103728 RepID=A0ABT1IIZ1_9PSEU|nr:beta-ketoacyl-[acyl-carrier-protein] synthase family protein [Actinokineospora diospyrosa]MCP2272612.1 3-oxoacyl-[acyl-carrier-protein] synthase II [Actinokineospora diospyrosa]